MIAISATSQNWKKKTPKKRYKLRHNYQANGARCTLHRPKSRYLGLRACCAVVGAEEEAEEANSGGRRHCRDHGSRDCALRFCSEYFALSRVQISEEWTSRVRVEVFLILLASAVVGCCFCVVSFVLVCLLGRAAGSGIKEKEDGRG